MPRLAVLLALTLLGACSRPAPDVDPKLAADGYYLAAQSAYLKGDFAAAHTQFDEVRKLNPADPRLPAAEGEVFLSEAKVPEAIAAFEEASTRDPKRATTWSRLGYLYALKGERERAQAALDKALAGNAKDFNALETLAELQLKDGKLDDAVNNYVRASQSAPEASRPELVQKAAGALAKKGRGPEALAVLEAAVKRGVKAPELLGELGDRLVEVGRLEEAGEAYGEAAKASPGDPSLWELVGELALKRGKLPEAEDAFRRSLAVKERGVVHVALARLCQARQDAACVKRELDRAIETASGEELRETLDLSDLLASVSRKKDALSLLRTASEEPEQKGNSELQLKTARLARELGEKAVTQAACARALGGAGHPLKCP